jgi:iron complex outermembrane receptor protein
MTPGPWKATFFINNLFDEYYETGIVGTPLFNQVLTDDAGGPVNQRTYYAHVGAPRSIGVRFNYSFD